MKLTIIHTNDLHSHLLPATISKRGGLARIASIIKEEKTNKKEAENELVLALDSGDFLMGTLFQVLEIDTGFQLHLMKEVGYDVVSLGNHEFDFGIQALCTYLKESYSLGCPAIVLSNLRPKFWNTPDNKSFKELFEKKIIEHYHIIEQKGMRVGIFGIFGNRAYESAPNANTLNLKRRITTARKMVRTLKKSGVDFIICLSHSGIKKNDTDQWCGEDIDLAKKVDGIDLIISAHTHTQLLQPIVINKTPIVQASCFGQFVGKIELEKGQPFNSYELIEITDNLPLEEDIQLKLNTQLELVNKKIERISGFDNDKVYFSSDFPLLKGIGKMGHKYNLAQFIADAIYYYINKNTVSGCDITFLANGMIREQMGAGNHHLDEIFQVSCLGISKDPTPGYPLALIYITPFALKQALELLIIQEGQLHCQFCGVKVEVDYSNITLNKIKHIYILDKQGVYQKLDYSINNRKLISLSADYYAFSFLPMVKKKTLGLINILPRQADGKKIRNLKESIINFSKIEGEFVDGKIWKAILEYGQSFPDTNGDGIPDLPSSYAPTHDPQAILS